MGQLILDYNGNECLIPKELAKIKSFLVAHHSAKEVNELIDNTGNLNKLLG